MTVTNSYTLTLGCGPQVLVTINELEGGQLWIQLQPEDPDGELPDLDGFFFNLADDSTLGSLNIWPEENEGGEWAPVTDVQADANAVDTLSNGAQVAEQYDLGFQFGTVDDSTEGTVNYAAFTLWSDDGPMSIDDIDLENMALVIDSDTPDGLVLTVNDGVPGFDDSGTGDTGSESDECAFVIEGPVNTEVVLTDLGDGNIQVSLEVLEGDDPDATGQIGDIQGLFFDIGNESLLGGMTVTGTDVTGSEFDANSVSNLGNGVNMNGQSDPFDGGVRIGTQGIGKDDIQETTFILHADGLTLVDFSGQEFGLRLTSVGDEDGERDDSLKLTGECKDQPKPPVCDSQYSLEDVLSLMVLEEPEEQPDDEPVMEDCTGGEGHL